MSTQRLIGQDSELSLQIGGVVVASTMHIESAELTYKMEIKEQGFLGETFTRVDAVYKNVSGNLKFQSGSAEAFDVIARVVEYTRTRQPPRPVVTLKTYFIFPDDGRKRLIVCPKMVFGDIPISLGGREEYTSFTYNWSCELAPIVAIG